jgi:hypothetical protein
MATKPTRLQQQACELLAEALDLIHEAYRLDGKSKLDTRDLDEIAARIAQVSSAFPLDQIVVKAIERRAKALELTSSAADLIMLSEGELEPLRALRLADHEFKELVRKLEEELGGI